MADQRRSRRNQQTTAPEVAVVEAIGRGLLALFNLIFKTGGKTASSNQQRFAEIREHWKQVEFHLYQENTRAMAVSDADKLLDAALQAKNVAGVTLGERLKAAESLFPRDLYQDVWDAHKLRNTLAHEIGAKVSQSEAQTAVTTFRRALTHLGILR